MERMVCVYEEGAYGCSCPGDTYFVRHLLALVFAAAFSEI